MDVTVTKTIRGLVRPNQTSVSKLVRRVQSSLPIETKVLETRNHGVATVDNVSTRVQKKGAVFYTILVVGALHGQRQQPYRADVKVQIRTKWFRGADEAEPIFKLLDDEDTEIPETQEQ